MSVQSIFGSLVDREKQVREALVAAIYTPGDLLEIAALKTQRHSVASGASNRLFAIENPSNGGTIDTNTVAGERAPYVIALRGTRIYGFVADTVTVVAGVSRLISNADGSLKLAVGTETDEEIVATADQSLTASGKTRCWVIAA